MQPIMSYKQTRKQPAVDDEQIPMQPIVKTAPKRHAVGDGQIPMQPVVETTPKQPIMKTTRGSRSGLGRPTLSDEQTPKQTIPIS